MTRPSIYRRLLLNPALRHLQAWLADPQPARRGTYRPCLEELEDRRVPSVTAVGNEIEIHAPGFTSALMPPGSSRAAATAPDGRFVVTWTRPEDLGVYVRVYNADGTARTGEFLVASTDYIYTGAPNVAPSVAMDAQGDFVVTWADSDSSGNGVFARLYNFAGTAQGAAFQVNQFTAGNQDTASVAMDAQGDFVVTWQSEGQDGSGTGVFARLYSLAGVAQTNEFQVNQFTAGNQGAPTVAMDTRGDFVVTWQSDGQDGSGTGVFARLYNAAGTAQDNEFQVNQFTTGNQDTPAVAMDAQGDFAVTWQSDSQDGTGTQVFARLYNAAGTAQTDEFHVDPVANFSQNAQSVAMDAQGDFVVTWQSYSESPEPDNVIDAQRYSAAGAAQGSAIQVNSAGSQIAPTPASASVAMDAQGDFVVKYFTAVGRAFPSPPVTAFFEAVSARQYFLVNPPAGFVYDPTSRTLTITASAAQNNFTYTQATVADPGGETATTDTITLNGVPFSLPDTTLAGVVVNAGVGANTAILIANDTYIGSDGQTHETRETAVLGTGGGVLQKYDSNGNPYSFLTLNGFQTSYAYLGRADNGQIFDSPGNDIFVTAGNYSYMTGPNIFRLISGGTSVYGYTINGGADQAWQYDAGDGLPETGQTEPLDAFVASGNAYSYMSGTGGNGTFFNEAVGFPVTYGISTHGNAFAYLIDSPGNDTFDGMSGVSYLSGTDSTGSLFNVAEGFVLVYGESFVGGTDYAYNYDPSHNILNSRWILLT